MAAIHLGPVDNSTRRRAPFHALPWFQQIRALWVEHRKSYLPGRCLTKWLVLSLEHNRTKPREIRCYSCAAQSSSIKRFEEQPLKISGISSAGKYNIKHVISGSRALSVSPAGKFVFSGPGKHKLSAHRSPALSVSLNSDISSKVKIELYFVLSGAGKFKLLLVFTVGHPLLVKGNNHLFSVVNRLIGRLRSKNKKKKRKKGGTAKKPHYNSFVTFYSTQIGQRDFSEKREEKRKHSFPSGIGKMCERERGGGEGINIYCRSGGIGGLLRLHVGCGGWQKQKEHPRLTEKREKDDDDDGTEGGMGEKEKSRPSMGWGVGEKKFGLTTTYD
ncbi:hypothetical protein BXZ70DRAFT_1077775 [Cristinia sonorae]|uniref:Uncharacterized protein n=1 Tax=Cristinia sonorae TaxID=1940300 RepID=A0A8K0UNP8_9AGAR|nr:hypothetical protein BXZ70DRAFT_1077775 [Cristinia sonorae]